MARAIAGITQTELAAQLGCHPTTLARWERDAGEPVASQITVIARLCGLSETEWMHGRIMIDPAVSAAGEGEIDQ